MGKLGTTPVSTSRRALHRICLPPCRTLVSRTRIFAMVTTRGRLGNVPYRTGG